ncbi:MAG: flagellar basal body rod protein FlgB [Treponema sp.]|nr:flagellar basal body rod protein FlgB [Treponema sp.]MBD5440920.1 flagellar basal body rod protein FlgB [Treponema sp.]
MGMNSFSRSVDLLQKALDVNALRYQVTANNIANSEVPNFKRSTVNFESELKRAFESRENARNSFDLARTNSKHVSIHNVIDPASVKPRRTVDWASTENSNGNSVNVETEAMNVIKIQMQYRLLSQLENFEFNQVRTAMQPNR